MKHGKPTFNNRRSLRVLTLLSLSLLLISCVSDPAKVDVKLEESAPEVKVTSYTTALDQLGLMTEIYDTGLVKIQSQGIGDNTGTAGSTGGEIQRDITEIMKSTLNTIGGNVQFIEYDPAYIQNQMVTGYSDFSNKLVPDVVVTGGITEFDRGLETRGDGTDVGAEANLTGMPGWLPSQTVGIDYGQSGKTGKARITLDFNLKDFQTLAAIKKMTTTNSMVVNKAMANEEFGITLFGPTFGRKGSVKKVQGRHNVVRLLVQVSMVQMVGKYLMLPYWRLLGDGSEPDKVVMDTLAKRFYQMDPVTQVAKAQELLYLHGYDVPITGTLDAPTLAALKQFNAAFKPAGNSLDLDTFVSLYVSVPLNHQTLGRRTMLARLYPDGGQQAAEAQMPQTPQLNAPVPQQQAAQQQQQTAAPQQQQQQQAAAPQAKPAPRAGKKGMIGRMLTDDEW